jgi:hypothetical protein
MPFETASWRTPSRVAPITHAKRSLGWSSTPRMRNGSRTTSVQTYTRCSSLSSWRARVARLYPDGQVDGAGTNQIVFLNQNGYQTRAAMGGGGISSAVGGKGRSLPARWARMGSTSSWPTTKRSLCDAVDGCEVLSRRPGGLIRIDDGQGGAGPPAWQALPGPRSTTSSPASWVTRPAGMMSLSP